MRRKNYVKELCTYLTILLLISAFMSLAYAEPGTVTEHVEPSAVTTSSIVPQVTETGKICLSVDGLGTLDTGTIQVEKPTGATVRSAYMAAADVWGSSGGPLPDGAVQINGNNVNWDSHDPLNANSAWSDVTAIVKPIVDAAPAGIVDLDITETMYLDGSIIAVIFDDPSQTTDNTIVLLFGSQEIAGDTFAIGLAEPIDKSDPNLVLDMSLGISYGYQGTSQYSIVEVNGNRMTTSAGGQDDGYDGDGGLLTVGGIGDSNNNPADPYAMPTGPRSDDELYNLIPFVSDGDTSINVYTENPSNDDNIFFASLFLASTTAVVGEGILLAPVSASNPVGTSHTVTATVQDDSGNPIVGRDVTFTIVSGPHVGQTSTVQTDASGEATLTYTGTSTGTDVIEATMVDSHGNLVTSNQVTKEWYSVGGPTVESADISGATQDVFQTGDSVPAVGSGYAATTTYDLYVVEDTTWVDGMAIPSRVAGTETSVTTDGSGDIPAGTLIWTSSVEGEYDIIVDVDGNGQYDAPTDGLDSGSPGFVVIGLPSTPVPALAPIGIIALIGLLCVIGMIRIRRRFN